MKVVIPEHIGDITLGQFQKYHELIKKKLEDYEFNKRKINIFTGLLMSDIERMTNKSFNTLVSDIDEALNKNVEFKDRFVLDGLEFGIIPNFDKIKRKEFVDMSLYPENKIETLHNLMAILFRPVVKTQGNTYLIEDYEKSSVYADTLKHMPMSIVDGALVFFWKIAKELNSNIPKSLIQQQARVKQQ